jgi:hypothetical protein
LFGHDLLYLIYTAKYKLSAPEDEKGCPFHLPVLHPYLPKCCTLIYRFAALLITESVVLLITDYNAQSKSIFFNGLYQWNGAKWVISQIKIPVDKQSILFSDEKFIVYGECSGEFGGTIYFFDRQSKETYFTESTCANTVFKKNGQYQILAQLGHMMGTSEIKVIENPQKLTKAKKGQLKNRKKLGENLGYQDKTNAFTKSLDLFGIQLFSTFQINDRRLFLVHLNEKTFLAEIDGKEIQIVNPLFNNDKYTHNPITKSYGEYTLINMDFYGIAIDREVSVMIIKDDKIILLDWNENHNR